MKRYTLIAIGFILLVTCGCSTSPDFIKIHRYYPPEAFEPPLQFGEGDFVWINIINSSEVTIPPQDETNSTTRVAAEIMHIEIREIAEFKMTGRLLFALEPDGTSHSYDSETEQLVEVNFRDIELVTKRSGSKKRRKSLDPDGVLRGVSRAAAEFVISVVVLSLIFSILSGNI